MSLTLLDWRRQVAELYHEVRMSTSPSEAHAEWRARRDGLFRSHPASPLPRTAAENFAGLTYGRYDSAFRFELPVETDLPPRVFDVAGVTEGVVPLQRLGCVQLPGLGDLDVWWLADYAGGVFLPFSDLGLSSYAGGRYVLDTAKGADLGGDIDPVTGRGSLVVDLNFAYNPSCAYDPAWQCPLAPIGNRLGEVVEVGERLPQSSADVGATCPPRGS